MVGAGEAVRKQVQPAGRSCCLAAPPLAPRRGSLRGGTCPHRPWPPSTPCLLARPGQQPSASRALVPCCRAACSRSARSCGSACRSAQARLSATASPAEPRARGSGAARCGACAAAGCVPAVLKCQYVLDSHPLVGQRLLIA